MASLRKVGQSLGGFCQKHPAISLSVSRYMSNGKTEQQQPPVLQDEPMVDPKRSSWFRRLIPIRSIDPGKESHSSQLSEKDTVFELQLHQVKPENMEAYLNEYRSFVDLVKRKETGAELVGSWTVEIGDQDEAVHLWRYTGGYSVLNRSKIELRSDQEFVDFRISRNKMLRSRKNQILLAFSFWGDIQPRVGPNIYELRSYILKPGTMIEWGNNWAKGLKCRQTKREPVCGFFAQMGDLSNAHHLWDPVMHGWMLMWLALLMFQCLASSCFPVKQAKGIKYRQAQNEPVAGFFSHIGDLNFAHHVWAYESLQSRKEVREAAWQRPGWDDCVAYTVPLIRQMTSKILIPTPFSPLQ